MQQNYINPQTLQLPDIAAVKRQLQFKNYQFNQQQLQRRQEILKRQKMLEVQQTNLANERALIEMQNAKLRQLHKKYQVQDTLQKEYDRQIYTRERIKTEEKSYDKFYSQKQKELLENHERSRIHDMTKIYNFGSSKKDKSNYYPNRSLLTQGCEDSLDKLRHQSHQQMRCNKPNTPTQLQQNSTDFPRTQSLKAQKKSLGSIQQPSLQNSRTKKYSAVNLQYSDYLKRQIDRKQKQKEEQKRRQLEKDRTWMDRQARSYHETLEQTNYLNQKKKWDYATGLDKQLSWKKQYQHRM